MNRHLNLSLHRSLLAAGLVFGAVASQAAGGYSVSPGDEALVSVGMSSAAVEQALGRPATKRSYGNEPGPTWSYRITGDEQTLFDVDFDADGKVLSVSERMDASDRGHAGRS